MDWKQNILNAQVSINRLVWGINNPTQFSPPVKKHRDAWFKENIRKAITELQDALTEYDNQLKFK